MSLVYFLENYNRLWSDENYMFYLRSLILPYLRYNTSKKNLYRLVKSDQSILEGFHYAKVFFEENGNIWTEYVGDIEYNKASKDIKEDIKRQLSLAKINPDGYFIYVRQVERCYLVYNNIYYPTETIATLIPGNPNKYNISLIEVNKKKYVKGNLPLWNSNKLNFFNNIPRDILLEILSFEAPNISDEVCLNSPSISKRHTKLKSIYKNEEPIFGQGSIVNVYEKSPEHLRRFLSTLKINGSYIQKLYDTLIFTMKLNDNFEGKGILGVILGLEPNIKISLKDILFLKYPIPCLKLIFSNGFLPDISPFLSIFEDEFISEDIEETIDLFIKYGYKVTPEDRGISIICYKLYKTRWSNCGKHFEETRKWFLDNLKYYDVEYEQIEYITSKPLSKSGWKLIWGYFMDQRIADTLPETEEDILEILSKRDLYYIDQNSLEEMIIQLFRERFSLQN